MRYIKILFERLKIKKSMPDFPSVENYFL